MKILILGGTGAMGVSLVDLLARQGHDVYITSRSKHLDGKNVHYLQGDAHDLAWLEQVAIGQKYNALVDFMIYSTEDFAQRRDTLLNMAEQYVFLSSSRVYSNSPDKPITEETPRLLDSIKDKEYLATDEYALAKAREENILRAGDKQNYTIIRPYITYNDERLQLGTMEKEAWLYRAMHGHRIVLPKDMAESLTTMTYGYDVADGIASLLGKKEALGEAFHIVAPEPMKWRDVLEIYCGVLEQLLGRKIKIKYLSDSYEFSCVFKNRYQVYCDRLYKRVFDSSKIKNIGGKRDYMLMEDGLEKCMKAFIAKGAPFRPISYTIEGWLDKKTGERANIAAIPSLKKKIQYLLGRYTAYAKYESQIRKFIKMVIPY